jgi:hypothetical protein
MKRRCGRPAAPSKSRKRLARAVIERPAVIAMTMNIYTHVLPQPSGRRLSGLMTSSVARAQAGPPHYLVEC